MVQFNLDLGMYFSSIFFPYFVSFPMYDLSYDFQLEADFLSVINHII